MGRQRGRWQRAGRDPERRAGGCAVLVGSRADCLSFRRRARQPTGSGWQASDRRRECFCVPRFLGVAHRFLLRFRRQDPPAFGEWRKCGNGGLQSHHAGDPGTDEAQAGFRFRCAAPGVGRGTSGDFARRQTGGFRRRGRYLCDAGRRQSREHYEGQVSGHRPGVVARWQPAGLVFG